MDILLEEHKSFIILLLKHNVDFILVGGYAVIYHGYLRTTKDMDLWLNTDEINKQKFLNALEEYGIQKSDIKKVEQLNFRIANAFHIGKAPYRIDFLTKLVGLKYEEARKESVYLPLRNNKVPVLQLHHLVTNKLLAARPKDKADVDELQKIQKLKNKK